MRLYPPQVREWEQAIEPLEESWWLLLPQGVSGAIKKKGGLDPFRELARMKMIPLGQAVITGAGTLPYKAIIHVAGINLVWKASEKSIQDSVRNALSLASAKGFKSIAFPIIGAGSGRFSEAQSREIMLNELQRSTFDGRVVVVKFIRGSQP